MSSNINTEWNNMNTAQKVFGMSYTNTYIYVGIFLCFIFLLILAQVLINKYNKKKWLQYLPFVAVILALILVLPFESFVNYSPWGYGNNHSMWYAQIMQFSIVLGNIYMIFLVLFLISALFFNIIKTMYDVIINKRYKYFFKSLGLFFVISISMLLLINLYRVFPIFNYDMNNDPAQSFVAYGSPIGIQGFDHQGFWFFFATNFLIAYFFTGNYDVSYNTNTNYSVIHPLANPTLPVQVPIVLSLFALAVLIGIVLGFKKARDQKTINFLEKAKKTNNKLLNIVYACLSVASLSFFSESMLQSQIGTWMHIVFVFVIMGIAWLLFYIVSCLYVVRSYKLTFKEYCTITMKYLHNAFNRNNLNEDEFKLAEQHFNQYINKNGERKIVDIKIQETHKQIGFISETVVFPMALIGYLSFMPTNGWVFTSNVDCAGYWFAMFFGSLFCFVGSYGIAGMATVGQNMQASCAFNVMCGTNTGIFGPFGFVMNKFRVQVDLNFIFALLAVENKNIQRDFVNHKLDR